MFRNAKIGFQETNADSLKRSADLEELPKVSLPYNLRKKILQGEFSFKFWH
jgi:hypothetical protein